MLGVDRAVVIKANDAFTEPRFKVSNSRRGSEEPIGMRKEELARTDSSGIIIAVEAAAHT